MAKDLILGKSNRCWSRDDLVSGEQCREVVVAPSRGPGFLGWSLGIMLGSRLLTGKWPWYWFRRVDERLERR